MSYDVLSTDHVVNIISDGDPFTVNLPAGVEGRELRIINSGVSGVIVTIVPNGTEKLFGVNSSDVLYSDEVVDIIFCNGEWR